MDNILIGYNTKCEEASFNRLEVMAFVLLVQTFIIIPATLLAISLNGNGSVEFALTAIFSFCILVALLGDLPSKIVLLLFAASTLMHLGIFVSVI